MKVLTLNIHSHGSDFDPAVYHRNMKALAAFMKERGIDAAALQECSQEEEKPACPAGGNALPMHYVPADPAQTVREDNCALVLASELQAAGLDYYWTWTGAKLGYGKYNEGMAFFSRLPLRKAESFYISGIRDFSNWKTRKALLAQTEAGSFCDVHMGWWNDPEENFRGQMERLEETLREKGLCGTAPAGEAKDTENADVFLLGDFNSPAEIRGEGHDMLLNLDWHDTYEAAEKKDSGITVPGNIDGWRDGQHDGMRLDYIWSRKPCRVPSSEVVLNGLNGPVISDHFGVLADIVILNNRSISS